MKPKNIVSGFPEKYTSANFIPPYTSLLDTVEVRMKEILSSQVLNSELTGSTQCTVLVYTDAIDKHVHSMTMNHNCTRIPTM